MVWLWSGDVLVSSDSSSCRPKSKHNAPSLPLEFLRPTLSPVPTGDQATIVADFSDYSAYRPSVDEALRSRLHE